MRKQTIKFTIAQDGTVTEEVCGIMGNECEQLTKRIEDQLGEVLTRVYKPEYYEDVTLQQDQNQDQEQRQSD
tara:strand:+ start:1073 stop:1288 length:216 start_codon:yes stop_codon:yes gene_type:complete